MTIKSSLFIQVVFGIITLIFDFLAYFGFRYVSTDALSNAASILIALYLTFRWIDVCTTSIKIENGYLKIGSKLSNLLRLPFGLGNHNFLISDIGEIEVQYKKWQNSVGGIKDPYIGNGKAYLLIKTGEKVTAIPLDLFDAREVEKFVSINFKNK